MKFLRHALAVVFSLASIGTANAEIVKWDLNLTQIGPTERDAPGDLRQGRTYYFDISFDDQKPLQGDYLGPFQFTTHPTATIDFYAASWAENRTEIYLHPSGLTLDGGYDVNFIFLRYLSPTAPTTIGKAFLGMQAAFSSGQEVFVQIVDSRPHLNSISQVPEVDSWLLLTSGLVFIGTLSGRRKRARRQFLISNEANALNNPAVI